MALNKTLKNARERRYYAAHPEAKRAQSYKYLYGMTLADYDILLAKQNARCAMCKRHVSELTRILVIDHCHQTNKVRGLLCVACNSGLGRYEDKVFMQMCEDYLCR